jgi:hypothetical protein
MQALLARRPAPIATADLPVPRKPTSMLRKDDQ